VLPDDPLAQSGLPGISVAADEDVLLKTLRVSLLDRHLDPLSDRIREDVKVGRRTLLGSVASGIAYSVVRAANVLPEPAAPIVHTLLRALDLEDLVELTTGPGNEPAVRRKTCCLAFTLPQPRICSGCCLRSA
jgi:ferric iron reductase protein FhuF